MAQGKAFTQEQREMIIQSLKPHLELGFSRNKACELIGITPSTLSTWVKEDEALRIKLQGWENTMNALAMANIQSAMLKEAEMDDARKETSKWWAERRMKADFSTRTDITTNDKELPTPILGNVFTNHSDNENSESQEED